MPLPVVARVQHERYLPGMLGPDPLDLNLWGTSAEVDSHGWWQPGPDGAGGTSSKSRPIVKTLLVPAGHPCGDCDRWTLPGDGELLQVGSAQDYGHGPFGAVTPLLVHLSWPPEKDMVDECTITEPPRHAFDRTSRTEGLIDGPAVYSGRCKVEALNNQQTRLTAAGEQPVRSRTLDVSVPWHVSADLDYVVTVTRSLDPRLIGRRLPVVGIEVETNILVRHIQALDILN